GVGGALGLSGFLRCPSAPVIYPRGIEKCLNTLCICVKVVHGRHPRSFPPGVPNPRLPGPTGREPTSRPVGALVRFAQRTGVRSEFCPPAEPPRADRRGGRDGGGHRRRRRRTPSRGGSCSCPDRAVAKGGPPRAR